MSVGGARPGAGRKKGVPNKRTAAKIAEVEASGLTPLDYMLSVLRDTTESPDRRAWAAKEAAPYVHPKLSNIEHKGDQDKPIRMEFVWADG
jgi:hypothetical protein